MRASVNIHFLKSFFFLHSFGSVPWLRTTTPSLRFLRLSLPFFCFQAQIQLDCGEDNICVPDLKLAVYGWEEVIFLWFYWWRCWLWDLTLFAVVLPFGDFLLSDRSARAILISHDMFGPFWCLMPVTFLLFTSCSAAARKLFFQILLLLVSWTYSSQTVPPSNCRVKSLWRA